MRSIAPPNTACPAHHLHIRRAYCGRCASVAGSLYLSLGLGLIACPLCFYQRTFAFAVLGVLILGRIHPSPRIERR